MSGRISLASGDAIQTQIGGWSFDERTVPTFDSHVEKSVPFYHEGHSLITKISDFFVKHDSVCYDLGCSTGSLLKKLHSYHEGKAGARFIGIDREPAMISSAKRKCEGQGNLDFLVSDTRLFDFEASDFITAYYTVQFVPPKDRQELISKIYGSLNWGGAFLLFEKTRAPDARFQDITTALYNEYKLDQGYALEEILAKTLSLKGVLEPFSLEGNMGLLRRAGFLDICPVFKYLCFEGYLCIK